MNSLNSSSRNTPLVTVVVPAYNCERYLEDCLQSITNQTYSNLQVLVIDDQSSDATVAIADKHAQSDDRFTVIRKRNAGPGAARNDGLRLAQGRYLQYVDADDMLEPNAIKTLVSIAEDSLADVVSFDFDIIKENETISRSAAVRAPYPSLAFSDGAKCLRQIYEGHLGYFSWSFFYRLDSVRLCDMSYPTEIHLLEDMVMLNRLFRHDITVAYCNQSLYRYRLVASSLSHNANSKRARDGLTAVQEVEGLCSDSERQLFVTSALPTLLYLDSLLPLGDSWHRVIRRKLRDWDPSVDVETLDRKTAFKLFLAKMHMLNIINLFNELKRKGKQ